MSGNVSVGFTSLTAAIPHMRTGRLNVQARFTGQGLDPVASAAAEFSALIRSDLVRWAKVIKQAGIRVE